MNEEKTNNGFQCFHCLSNTVSWCGDFDFEDYGYEGEGIVQICHCSNCGAEIEYRISLNNEHTPIVMEVDEEHIKKQLDYFKNRDLVYVDGGRGYGKTQYEKLQHNWDELKTWIEEQRDFIENVPTFSRDIKNNHIGMIGSYNNCLEKMEEIEDKNNE